MIVDGISLGHLQYTRRMHLCRIVKFSLLKSTPMCLIRIYCQGRIRFVSKSFYIWIGLGRVRAFDNVTQLTYWGQQVYPDNIEHCLLLVIVQT